VSKVLLIENDKCVGCKNCEMICSLVHEGRCASSLSRIRVAKDERAGWNVPISCAMCEEPICVAVCPSGACSREPHTGIIIIDDASCIGCRQCVTACPFGHANFDPLKKTAFKCDLCQGDPQCAKWCWTGAITFGPLEEWLDQKRQHLVLNLHR